MAITFGKADSNPGVRQVYEISQLGESNPATVKTPKWLKIQAAAGQTVDEKDFRNELNVDNYGGSLVFEISVASKETKVKGEDAVKNWSKIGNILCG